NDYNIYDYYSLFSVVFQDHHFLPVSLSRIISCKKAGEEDNEKILACILEAGLKSKIDSLEKGVHTMLNKQINSDAVELSGGEEQKILLARALYKNFHILILDEPTAALDPIAESSLYKEYESICTNKTAIFISHRLASAKFCDKILFMEGGQIVETGSHEELMRLGGRYAEMFETQSKYYTQSERI
ncbi:MAG: ABC transporter ATP-binding protein/permease, partial [Prevotellaceae bacterium]|nr:ABC transporter ATP-binding protein/permease [Prevotellaceae bacterium]